MNINWEEHMKMVKECASENNVSVILFYDETPGSLGVKGGKLMLGDTISLFSLITNCVADFSESSHIPIEQLLGMIGAAIIRRKKK